VFDIFVERFKWKLSMLVMCGRNPLLLYMLHLVLLSFVTLPDVPGWYHSASPWLVFVQGVVLLSTLAGMALLLDRKKIYLSI
jgi:hypothetical protein